MSDREDQRRREKELRKLQQANQNGDRHHHAPPTMFPSLNDNHHDSSPQEDEVTEQIFRIFGSFTPEYRRDDGDAKGKKKPSHKSSEHKKPLTNGHAPSHSTSRHSSHLSNGVHVNGNDIRPENSGESTGLSSSFQASRSESTQSLSQSAAEDLEQIIVEMREIANMGRISPIQSPVVMSAVPTPPEIFAHSEPFATENGLSAEAPSNTQSSLSKVLEDMQISDESDSDASSSSSSSSSSGSSSSSSSSRSSSVSERSNKSQRRRRQASKKPSPKPQRKSRSSSSSSERSTSRPSRPPSENEDDVPSAVQVKRMAESMIAAADSRISPIPPSPSPPPPSTQTNGIHHEEDDQDEDDAFNWSLNNYVEKPRVEAPKAKTSLENKSKKPSPQKAPEIVPEVTSPRKARPNSSKSARKEPQKPPAVPVEPASPKKSPVKNANVKPVEEETRPVPVVPKKPVPVITEPAKPLIKARNLSGKNQCHPALSVAYPLTSVGERRMQELMRIIETIQRRMPKPVPSIEVAKAPQVNDTVKIADKKGVKRKKPSVVVESSPEGKQQQQPNKEALPEPPSEPDAIDLSAKSSKKKKDDPTGPAVAGSSKTQAAKPSEAVSSARKEKDDWEMGIPPPLPVPSDQYSKPEKAAQPTPSSSSSKQPKPVAAPSPSVVKKSESTKENGDQSKAAQPPSKPVAPPASEPQARRRRDSTSSSKKTESSKSRDSTASRRAESGKERDRRRNSDDERRSESRRRRSRSRERERESSSHRNREKSATTTAERPKSPPVTVNDSSGKRVKKLDDILRHKDSSSGSGKQKSDSNPPLSVPIVAEPSPPAPAEVKESLSLEEQWDSVYDRLPPLDTTAVSDHQRNLARIFKAEADSLGRHDTRRSAIYLQSVVHFLLMGHALESGAATAQNGYAIYKSTLGVINAARAPPPDQPCSFLVTVARYIQSRTTAVLCHKLYSFVEDKAVNRLKACERMLKEAKEKNAAVGSETMKDGAARKQNAANSSARNNGCSPAPGIDAASPYSVGSTGSASQPVPEKPAQPAMQQSSSSGSQQLPGEVLLSPQLQRYLVDYQTNTEMLVNAMFHWNRAKSSLASEKNELCRRFDSWLYKKAPLQFDGSVEELARHLHTALWTIRAIPEYNVEPNKGSTSGSTRTNNGATHKRPISS